ncbi:MAG: asparagine synthase (glutamine-hydrolyzing) [Acidimicrobiia bacterium]|nr:asparagine synthase (glutamine-hydrolyzing) [Acidimicrobiia bacterium]
MALAHTTSRRARPPRRPEPSRWPAPTAAGSWSSTASTYNAGDLRRRLPPPPGDYRGHSDTEILLNAISVRGVERALRAASGMWAIAAWDTARRQLHLTRDRFGEKPLYVGWCGPDLVFSSELPAFRAHPDFKGTIDRSALGEYLRWGAVPAPSSIFEQVRKVPPATHVVCHAPTASVATERYWEVPRIGRRHTGAARPGSGGRDATVDTFSALYGEAVARQLESDVPIGGFLSGGVDSTLTAAMGVRTHGTGSATFTIGVHDPSRDEAPHARAVAKHLGTEHHERYVDDDELVAVAHELPSVYDEPIADISQIPTVLLSRFAREHVTVALSGDGGDEIFAGYRHYERALARREALRRIPRPLARGGRVAARCVSRYAGSAIAPAALPVSGHLRDATLADQLRTAGEFLADEPVGTLHRFAMSVAPFPRRLVVGAPDPVHPAVQCDDTVSDPLAAMMRADLMHYLPDRLLTKVDRAAMSVALETRHPLLDPSVIEYVWGHADLTLDAGDPKWLPKAALARHGARRALRPTQEGVRCASRRVDARAAAPVGRRPARP